MHNIFLYIKAQNLLQLLDEREIYRLIATEKKVENVNIAWWLIHAPRLPSNFHACMQLSVSDQDQADILAAAGDDQLKRDDIYIRV